MEEGIREERMKGKMGNGDAKKRRADEAKEKIL
jgi:hypothetical protein